MNYVQFTPSKRTLENIMTAINQQIEQVATLENAQKYEQVGDKFVFCLNLLGLSLTENGDRFCDVAVMKLEDKFDALLGY